MWNKWNSHTLLMRMQSDIATLEKTVWQFLTQLNIPLGYDLEICLRIYLSKRNKNMSTQMFSFLRNYPNWKQPIYLSSSECINKLVHLWSGILFENKKKQTINICNSIGDSQIHYTKGKKPGSKATDAVWFYVCFFVKRKTKKKKTKGTEMRSLVAGVRNRGEGLVERGLGQL